MSQQVTIGEQLESMIDHSTLAMVVDTLAVICFEKAEHITTNWQDSTTARNWNDAGNKLTTLARGLERSFGR